MNLLLLECVYYLTLTDLEINYHENETEIEELKNGSVSIACIACVGYYPSTTTIEDKWTDVAEVHSITGVKTSFTLSSSHGSTTSIQVKSVFKNGTWEVSGSKSITFTDDSAFPALQNTSVNSLGRIAQTKIRYHKTIWEHPNGNSYTKVSANSALGGTNWGNSVGGNGASWYSVSGSEVMPGSAITKTQSTSNTYSKAASVSVYGGGVFLNNTTLSSSQNQWRFEFATGTGFGAYKIYGVKHNLTARN